MDGIQKIQGVDPTAFASIMQGMNQEEQAYAGSPLHILQKAALDSRRNNAISSYTQGALSDREAAILMNIALFNEDQRQKNMENTTKIRGQNAELMQHFGGLNREMSDTISRGMPALDDNSFATLIRAMAQNNTLQPQKTLADMAKTQADTGKSYMDAANTAIEAGLVPEGTSETPRQLGDPLTVRMFELLNRPDVRNANTAADATRDAAGLKVEEKNTETKSVKDPVTGQVVQKSLAKGTEATGSTQTTTKGMPTNPPPLPSQLMNSALVTIDEAKQANLFGARAGLTLKGFEPTPDGGRVSVYVGADGNEQRFRMVPAKAKPTTPPQQNLLPDIRME